MEIIESMTRLLNIWWETETVPRELTQAHIASVYKKGNTDLQDNYRPLSLLNIIYKIYVKIIKQRLDEGIEHLLQYTQFGFRKSRKPAY